MDSAEERRTELGAFLRARRDQVARTDFGLPPLGRGRIAGLRREEVSYLSGVSVTWYTWLEQGRDINPSRQVLDAIARTLHLTTTEHSYVLSLVGYTPVQPREAAPVAAAPRHVQRLLDALDEYPAYAITPDWGIAGWNTAYAALYPNVATVSPEQRNLLWLVFTDPYVHDLLPDWAITSRRFLAEFRAETGKRLGDPGHAYLISRLIEASPDFRVGWESHDIQGFASRERAFHHPLVGDLSFEHHQLSPSDHPDLHVITYTPVLSTDTPERLRKLLQPVP